MTPKSVRLSENSIKARRDNIEGKKVNAQIIKACFLPKTIQQLYKFIDQNYRFYGIKKIPGAKLCSIDH